MADEINPSGNEFTSPSRRTVVTTAAQVAVTAPAVALLLNATSKSAFAQISPYAPAGAAAARAILDDSTFGNNEENVDGSPDHGIPSQDDHV